MKSRKAECCGDVEFTVWKRRKDIVNQQGVGAPVATHIQSLVWVVTWVPLSQRALYSILHELG